METCNLSCQIPANIWNGPAKNALPYIWNNYLVYLFIYGIVGFVLFLTFVLYTWVVTTRIWVYKNRSENGQYMVDFLLSINSWFVAIFTGNIANTFSEQFKIVTIFYLLIGVSISYGVDGWQGESAYPNHTGSQDETP